MRKRNEQIFRAQNIEEPDNKKIQPELKVTHNVQIAKYVAHLERLNYTI